MVESKGFFQVFPDLKLEHNLTELLNLVEVNKISTNHTKDAIRVYMTGTRIIPKKVFIWYRMRFRSRCLEEHIFMCRLSKIIFYPNSIHREVFGRNTGKVF